ncbi:MULTISPECIES: helix-turn-helix domain-containing protein [Brevundimonas]|uniref:helix-turn-helix domain-containing protein n=1 Tax=Brevundimonas TaxID=41275 RepID=UPI00257A95AC|nr:MULTISPECIES: helix-turn-helix transcriptional regulator [Brevundimonas]
MSLATWRKSKGLTLEQTAARAGIQSKGRMSRIERGIERCPTDLAIAIDRLTQGAVSVAELRPDLHDVRVIQPEARP